MALTHPEILQRLRDPGLIAILRADRAEGLLEAVGALRDGGIRAIEMTMTTPNALETLQAAARQFGDEVLLGLGSVIDAETARLGIAAGAQFIVTPVFRPEVIRCCREHGTPIASGAYTPTEALLGHEAGADFVKIFPADTLGAGYIKAIKGPLPQLQIIPTGGVNLKTIPEFLAAGCVALAVGSNLVSKEILQAQDWAKLRETAAAYVAAVRAARR
jgi:2-dehydro-3-deoxyphosphogluconate aldolase/(4S)-4-hydroxy-2-oxoglutarate aldolase